MDQPDNVANPARGQLNRENKYFLCPRSRLRFWSRETGSAVPSHVSLLISILRLNLCGRAYLPHMGDFVEPPPKPNSKTLVFRVFSIPVGQPDQYR